MAEKTTKAEPARPEPEKVLPAGIQGVKGLAEVPPKQVPIHPPEPTKAD